MARPCVNHLCNKPRSWAWRATFYYCSTECFLARFERQPRNGSKSSNPPPPMPYKNMRLFLFICMFLFFVSSCL